MSDERIDRARHELGHLLAQTYSLITYAAARLTSEPEKAHWALQTALSGIEVWWLESSELVGIDTESLRAALRMTRDKGPITPEVRS